MLSIALCLLTLIQSTWCSEPDGKVTQELRTSHGLSSFAVASMHHVLLRKKLIDIAQAQGIPSDCMSIVLEYCRAWKKYAEIPTLKRQYAHPRAVFVRYKDRECLVTQDTFNTSTYVHEWEDDTMPLPDDESVKIALNVWDLESKKLCAQIPDTRGDIIELQTTPDGKRLVVCFQDKIIRTYDTHTLCLVAQLPFKLAYPPQDDDEYQSQRKKSYWGISSDSALIAAASEDGLIYTWDLIQNKAVAAIKLKLSSRSVDAIAVQCVSPDGHIIVAQDKSVNYMWDSTSLNHMWDGPKNVEAWVTGCYEPQRVLFLGRTTLLTNYENELRTHTVSYDEGDIELSGRTCSLKGQEVVGEFAITHDQTLCAIGGRKNVLIKDLVQQDIIATLPTSNDQTYVLSFSPNNRYLAATNSYPGTAVVFQDSYDVNENNLYDHERATMHTSISLQAGAAGLLIFSQIIREKTHPQRYRIL